MFTNKAASTDKAKASVMAKGSSKNGAFAHGVYKIQCFDKEGNLKWEDTAANLVVEEGAAFMNDTFFSGVSYSADWYIGLIEGPGPSTIAGTDTLASKAWTEYTDYDTSGAGERQPATFNAATSDDPSVIDTSAPAVFEITGGGGTIAGAFLTDVDTGTSGVLFSASDFQSPGDRVVVAGDILNVSYEFSLDQTP